MGRVAVEQSNWSGYNTYTLPGGTYDQDKLGLGKLMTRKNDVGNTGKWVGPIPLTLTRPFE